MGREQRCAADTALLIDLDGPEGLWRAAAFLGLGITLVGVGLAYQRLFSDDRGATPTHGQ